MSTTEQSKLPKRLHRDFDRMVMKRFREWEKAEHKLAAFRNHLHFTMHCKRTGLYPPSLKLKSSVKGQNAEKILLRAQRALLNERIRLIYKQLDYYNRLRASADEFLFSTLPADLYADTHAWMKNGYRQCFDQIRERQKRKFKGLQARSNTTKDADDRITYVDTAEANEVKSKWVKNVSDRDLSPDEVSLLSRGLNFAVTPSTLPYKDYVIGIESACRLIGPTTTEAETLRSDCVKILKNSPLPKPNISPKEREALKNLAMDKSITILPADKGRMTVVMNTSDYKQKAKELLGDSSTYKVLKKDPTAVFSRKIKKSLQELRQAEVIDEPLKRRLSPTSTLTPRFYGLPKVHKPGTPLRPIVASRGSITYNLARYIADTLSPLMGRNGYSLKNSAEMVKELREVTLDEDDILISFDVKALFTSVPVDQSLDIILERLQNDPTLGERTPLSAVQVRDLLAICLKTTYFQFDSVLYAQVEGAAMGSPVSPIVANIFMEWFEDNAIASFQYELTLWRRYVDDTIVAMCDELIDEFTEHINSIHPAIQFTREEEAEDGSLAMLDTKTKRDARGRLSFSVYRKPTHTDQYLQFDSNQPLQHKLGVIRTLHHRARTLCSTEDSLMDELEHLQKVLSISGYTKSAWVNATRPHTTTAQNDTNRQPTKGHITLPYMGKCSDVIARKIRSAGVKVHLRPYNTVRGQLVHPKDRVPKGEKCGLVYHVKCGECTASYVGETGRALEARLKEHRHPPSHVHEHLHRQQHQFQDSDVKVLHMESDWWKRGVAEAFHVMKEQPTLNQDRGRHTLPVLYRELMHDCDQRSMGSASGSQSIASLATQNASQQLTEEEDGCPRNV